MLSMKEKESQNKLNSLNIKFESLEKLILKKLFINLLNKYLL